MLTEKEAWQKLAQIFDTRPYYDDNGDLYVINDSVSFNVYGLCDGLLCVFTTATFNDEQIWLINHMRDKIRSLPKWRFGYKWPMNENGRKQRIQYCLSQAELCEKE